jgi:hypothetical protein
MTLPDERYRAVKHTEQFLRRLAAGDIPRVPKAVRDEARALLRHYPNQWDIDRLAEKSPDVITKEMEPLTKMVMQYDINQKENP